MENNKIEILLIEDDPYDASLTMRILKRYYFISKFIYLPGGREALDFIFGSDEYTSGYSTCNPKIILLDLVMPCINGRDVLRRIKTDILTRFMPVVTLAFSDYDPAIKEAYELGANGHIIKSLENDNFSEIITRLGLKF